MPYHGELTAVHYHPFRRLFELAVSWNGSSKNEAVWASRTLAVVKCQPILKTQRTYHHVTSCAQQGLFPQVEHLYKHSVSLMNEFPMGISLCQFFLLGVWRASPLPQWAPQSASSLSLSLFLSASLSLSLTLSRVFRHPMPPSGGPACGWGRHCKTRGGQVQIKRLTLSLSLSLFLAEPVKRFCRFHSDLAAARMR